MNNIKSIYLKLNYDKSNENYAQYREAVEKIFESPIEYLQNLEYIISSDVGLESFSKFTEKYGLPIGAVNHCISIFEKRIEESRVPKEKLTPWIEACNKLKEYKNKYIKAMAMFEYYINNDDYIKCYYGTTNNRQNRKLIDGMINKFGECAIPDMLIQADQLGSKELRKVCEFIESKKDIKSPKLYEWVADVCEGLKSYQEDTSMLRSIRALSASSEVEIITERDNDINKQALLEYKDLALYEYTEEEVENIRQLIEFKEYQMLWTDEFNPGLDDEALLEKVMQQQKEIVALHEKLDFLYEDGITDMLPHSMVEKDLSRLRYLRDEEQRVSLYDGNNDSNPEPEKSDEDDDSQFMRNQPASTGKKIPDVPEEDIKVPEPQQVTPQSSSDRQPYPMNQIDNRSRSTASNNLHFYFPPMYNNPYANNNQSQPNQDDSRYSSYYKSFKKNRAETRRIQKTQEQPNDTSTSVQKESSENEPWRLSIFDNDIFMEDDQTENQDVNETEPDSVGSADDDMPESDNVIRDMLMDVDRNLVQRGQKVKGIFQALRQVGKALWRPIGRVKGAIDNLIDYWYDQDEVKIKRQMVDPKKRRSVWNLIKASIIYGSAAKAGLLFSWPGLIFLFNKVVNSRGKEKRIKMELLSELKTEMEICDAKAKLAEENGDHKERFELLRLKNEIYKKYLRISGGYHIPV